MSDGILDFTGLNIRAWSSNSFSLRHVRKIILPSNGPSLVSMMFQNAINLEEIIIPFSVSTIPTLCFNNLTKLNSLIVNGNELIYGSVLDFTGSGINKVEMSAFQNIPTISKIVLDDVNYNFE